MIEKHWKQEPDSATVTVEEDLFDELFNKYDKDGNGTLDKHEAFILFKKWEATKKENTDLRKRICVILTVSSVVIVLLSAAVFGATYAAVAAVKDTRVNSQGFLLPKTGDQAVSTTSLGAVYKVTNSSDASPVCLTDEKAGAIINDVLDGKRVLLDIEAEETGATTVNELQSSGAEIDPEKKMCFLNPDGTETCFMKGKCVSAVDEHGRKLAKFGKPGWGMCRGYGCRPP